MDPMEKSAWDRAAEAGSDMSLIESNLRLGIAERLHKHDAALRTILKLRAAVKKRNERVN
jgi:hypothetical protein